MKILYVYYLKQRRCKFEVKLTIAYAFDQHMFTNEESNLRQTSYESGECTESYIM